MDNTLSLALLFLLTLASGFFSGSEIALFSLPWTKLKVYQSSHDQKKQLIAKLLRHSRDLLVTVFMLNTLVNILIQNVSSHMFGNMAGWGLKVGIPLLITLLFGELIPKLIALNNNVSFSYTVAPTIYFFQVLITPIRKLTLSITAPISRLLFFFLKKENTISKDELSHTLKASEKYGVLNREESQLISSYLHFQEEQIQELMRPREDVIFYNTEEPLTKLAELFVTLECTRIPVCQQTFDKVIGIIDAMQYLAHRESICSLSDLKKYLHKPFYVPENTSATSLLKNFEIKGEEIAIVVDEYGTTSGLITKEDLIEEVIGEIRDMRDRKKLYTQAGDNELIASGKLELNDFNEIFSTYLTSSSNMKTIGGWLIEKMGEIPKSGAQFKTEEFLFHILQAEPKRIRRLYIRKV